MKKSLLLMAPFALVALGVIWIARSNEDPRTQEMTLSSLPRAKYPATLAGEPVMRVLPPVAADSVPRRRQPIASQQRSPSEFRPSPHYLDQYAIRTSGYDDQIHPDEDLLQPMVQSRPSQGTGPQPPALPREFASPPDQPSESSPLPVAVPTLNAPPETTDAVPAAEPARPTTQAYDMHQRPGPDEDLLVVPDARESQAPSPPDQRPSRANERPSPMPQGTGSEMPKPQAPDSAPHSAPEPSAPSASETLPLPPAADRDTMLRQTQPERPLRKPRAAPALPHPGGPHAGAPHGATDLPPCPPGVDPHAEVFADSLYPSAKKCRTCHEQIYDEWASSGHAYAAISPMFQKFEQTINTLTRGTIGYFCMRCHSPVGTAVGHPRHFPIYDSIPAAAEGVTCVACHRVREQYGKVNGERRIEPGTVFDPVYGSGYGEGLAEVLGKKDYYKVKGPGEKGAGQDIHQGVIQFEQISSSHFCVSCHQVVVYPGIQLEVVWAQYRASPAAKLGITCQECHMGRAPGMAEGYECGPVAVVNGKPVSAHRKHSNHTFYGPGYSIAHPGVFPFHPDADDWSVEEWLQFDYRAGWGTDEFEDLVADGQIQVKFPEVWDNVDDRYDARDIVDANLKQLDASRHLRHRLMENGSHVEGPIFHDQPQRDRPLKFKYVVTNKNLGHNMPSGSLGAQPQLWLNVVLTGPDGQHLWESGYVDANGDVADLHSLEVAAGRIRRDQQLFNLQTKFLISHVKGTDREMFLPVNTDIDQLPFIRPSAFPITVMNHPPFIRMEAHSIAATGSRAAKYHVPARFISQPGNYRLTVRMRSRAEPIYFMKFCRATPEMIRNMNEGMLDYHQQSFDFVVP